MALVHIVGLFNIFVGLMITAAFLMMGWGIVLWIVRFGVWPSYRDNAIDVMKWSVTILFVLVVLLAIAKFVQTHTATAMFLIGAVIVLVAVFVGFHIFTQSGGGDDEDR